MNPLTHLLTGWMVANAAPVGRKDRALIALACVVPDADGLGILVDVATRGSAAPTDWYWRFHHVLGHGLPFALVVAAIAWSLGSRRWLVAGLAFLSFHLHLLGDLVGSSGRAGEIWSVPYLSPASDALEVAWSGQWALNAWPNIAITIVLIAATLWLACRRGFSPVEMISLRADRAVINTLRDRFGARAVESAEPTDAG